MVNGVPATSGRRGVTIKVRADTANAQLNLQKLNGSVDQINNRMTKFGKSAKIAAASLGAFVAVGAAARSISSVADNMTNLENKIALVTGRGRELNQTFLKLREISRITRSSVGSSAAIFNRFGLSLKDAGVSTEELFKVTEALQKAVKISGANAASAEAAIIQLGQGMAAGELRGEELNSVLEQTPRVAKALADELGVGVGQLRSLAKEGKLTSDVVKTALLNAMPKLNKEFAEMRATTGDLAVILRDEISLSVSKVNRLLGGSKGLQFIIGKITAAFRHFNDNFEDIVLRLRINTNKIKQFFSDMSVSVQNYIQNTFGGTRWEAAFNSIRDSVGSVAAFKETIVNVFSNIADIVSNNFGAVAGKVRDYVANIKGFFKDLYSAVHEYIGKTFKGPRWEAAFDALNSSLNKVKAFIGSILELFRGAWDAIVGNSYWPEIFYEGPRSIAGANTQSALDKARGWITSFVEAVKKLFKGARDVVTTFWSNIAGGIETADFSGLFDNIDIGKDIARWLGRQSDQIAAAITLGMGIAFRVGTKNAVIAGLAFALSPSVLNSESLQASLRSIGRGIGNFIAGVFEDGEGDFGLRLVQGLRDSILALGSGIWEGMFPESEIKSAALKGIIGALAVGAIGSIISKTVSGWFLGAFISLGKSGGTVALAATKAGAKGGASYVKGFSTKTKVGLAAGIGLALASAVGPELAAGGGLGAQVASAALDVGSWTAQGAFIGSLFGPAGAIGGAIVGALIGSVIAVWQNPDLISNVATFFKDTAIYMKDAVVEGFELAKDFVREWFVSFSDDIREGIVKGFESARGFVTSWFNSIFNTPISQLFKRADNGGRPRNPNSGQLAPQPFVPAYANGGRVRGPGTGTSDDIPAMLSNGEYVIKAQSVSKYGGDFLRMINEGSLPKFATGGSVGKIAALKGEMATLEAQRNRIVVQNKLITIDDPDYIPRSTKAIDDSIRAIGERIAELSEQSADNIKKSAAQATLTNPQVAATSAAADSVNSSGNPSRVPKKDKDAVPEFASELSGAIRLALTGDLKGAFTAIADSFTSKVLDNFANGLAESLAGSFNFEGLFGKIKDFGSSLFKNVDLSGLFGKLGKGVKSIFSGIGGLFGGGGGGGGFLSAITGFLGFSSGGVVPNIPGAQVGKDSVPTLLMPGERVMSKNDVRNNQRGGSKGGNSSTFHINVTGDISKQTRQEIMSMIPQIAQGVNANNHESNFQYR